MMESRAAAWAEGDATREIYGWIRDGVYDQAAAALERERQERPNSRAVLSLLGYCYYAMERFSDAVLTYAQLMRLCPKNDEYRLYYAQSLFKDGGDYGEVMSVAESLDECRADVRGLKLAVAYETADLARSLPQRVLNRETERVVYRCLLDGAEDERTPQALSNQGCLLYQEGKFEEARRRFMDAIESTGFKANLAYNCALCSYELREFGPALQYIAAILERSHSSTAKGRSPPHSGSDNAMRDAYVVEALNLKLAVEIELKNDDAAKEALQALPDRDESEIDPVTLYNSALISWIEEPEQALDKLSHLLENPPFPPPTVETMLLLCCHPEIAQFGRASEFLERFPDLFEQHVAPETRAFVEAMLSRETAPDGCLTKLTELLTRQWKTTQQLWKTSQRDPTDPHARQRFKAARERYLSVLMSVGHLHYERGAFGAVEELFLQSIDFSHDHPVWRTNVAHTFFVQGTKYEDAIQYYENRLPSHDAALLDVTPVILANLCVSYIMTQQTEAAEELMRRVEEEETKSSDSETPPQHLCIINLVIGTLYCSKGNFDFGISRVIKSFDPLETKLDIHTWHYAKKCFLDLLQHLSKHMTVLTDERLSQIIDFLTEVEAIAQTGHPEIAGEPEQLRTAFLAMP